MRKSTAQDTICHPPSSEQATRTCNKGTQSTCYDMKMINMQRFDDLLVRVLVWLALLNSASTMACPEGAVCCNNVEICDLPVTEILFGMVHNAMSSPSAGFIFFPNHIDDPIVESLDVGKKWNFETVPELHYWHCSGRQNFSRLLVLFFVSK